jgi:hypothetical protein
MAYRKSVPPSQKDAQRNEPPCNNPRIPGDSLISQKPVTVVTTVTTAEDSAEAKPMSVTEPQDPAIQPDPCSLCREDRFWCATCPPQGHWVCSCDHPRLAIVMRQGKAVPEGLVPGQAISWDSPLFGVLAGVYLGPVGRYQVRVHHPLAERDAVIPAAWVIPDAIEHKEARP